ncbi:MAG: hypothetical protein IJX87_05090 [Clostridia bacterium]|nr:hypothetical protein [Clostridia bacterium]
MKFVFTDSEKLCLYNNGKIEKYDSDYVVRYRESMLRAEKNREWKKNTDLMMSDDFYFEGARNEEVSVSLHSVSLTTEENKLIYAFSVNETSGLYYKFTDDEKKTEAHFLTSNEVRFLSLNVYDTGDILGTVQTDSVRANLAVFSKNDGDYKSLTDGDSFDENPSFDENGDLIFNSYGVGRDANNVFLTYTPSEILRLNLRSMEIETVISDERFSYVKPVCDGAGNLYCIRKPGDDAQEGNIFLDILLIPVRLVQAFIGLISTFVMCFAGKPMISGGRTGANDGSMAKNGKKDPKKIFINNNLINVEKELKKNKKSEDPGFIPRSWKLVKLTPQSAGNFKNCIETELASGVADFCLLTKDGTNTLLYTNGKHIFAVEDRGKESKRKKLLDTDFCLKVGALQTKYSVFEQAEPSDTETGLFDKI